MKAFKYFDLDSSGDVTFEEFVKAIEKIGVQIFSKEVYHLKQIPLLTKIFFRNIDKSTISTTLTAAALLTIKSSLQSFSEMPLRPPGNYITLSVL